MRIDAPGQHPSVPDPLPPLAHSLQSQHTGWTPAQTCISNDQPTHTWCPPGHPVSDMAVLLPLPALQLEHQQGGVGGGLQQAHLPQAEMMVLMLMMMLFNG